VRPNKDTVRVKRIKMQKYMEDIWKANFMKWWEKTKKKGKSLERG